MIHRLAQRLVIALCLLALTIVPLISSESTAASDQTNEFHWARKQSQFTVQAVNDVDGVWNKLLDQAVSNWNKSDVVTIKEVSGNHNASQDCAKTDGKITVCNWKYGTQDGWLGLTRLFFNKAGDHIAAATVQMNDSFFEQNGGKYNDDRARRHTICHEMGHAIGLDHVNTKSCMNDGGSDPDSAVFSKLEPISKDYRQLQQIYSHKDSFTTVAGKQKNKKDNKDKDKKRKKDRKGKKGKHKKTRNVDKDRKKRKRHRNRTESEGFFAPTSLPAVPSGLDTATTEIVQNLEDGSQVVTFISWADEKP